MGFKAIDKKRWGFLWKGAEKAYGGNCLVSWEKVQHPIQMMRNVFGQVYRSKSHVLPKHSMVLLYKTQLVMELQLNSGWTADFLVKQLQCMLPTWSRSFPREPWNNVWWYKLYRTEVGWLKSRGPCQLKSCWNTCNCESGNLAPPPPWQSRMNAWLTALQGEDFPALQFVSCAIRLMKQSIISWLLVCLQGLDSYLFCVGIASFYTTRRLPF